MLSMRVIGLRACAGLLCGAMGLAWAAPVAADPNPLTREEQAKVDQAIDKGVAFLKKRQAEDGSWQWVRYGSTHPVGTCALPAYALLESGVPVDDPVIQKAAKYLRPRVLLTKGTYELSLAILFFDRLGDPRDKKLIYTLALRLIAGQRGGGGWSYPCRVMGALAEQVLLNRLEELNKRRHGGEKTRDQARARYGSATAIAITPSISKRRTADMGGDAR